MLIRKCTESDIVSAGLFYDRVVARMDDHVNYPKWIYKVYPSEETVREAAAEGSQYLCTEDDQIVAAFILNNDPQGKYEKGAWKKDIPEGSYLVLHTLAVDPDACRRGVATQAINFCAKEAKRRGCRALRVDIVPENLPARRLYEKNGFTFAGDIDLERHIPGIPVFSLFEMNW